MIEGKVSVIMPAFNAALYIDMAIRSVLVQDYSNFELLIVNDGSTDSTEAHILAYEDSRIRYFRQNNRGVSAARNRALREMRGDFFCFLDADDYFGERSISARIEVFTKNSMVDYVDGTVCYINHLGGNSGQFYRPNYRGNPLELLLKLDRRCFFGPSWMIRKRPDIGYQFEEGLTHSEDLLFYIDISRQSGGGFYSFTNDTILFYRKTPGSAMNNLVGLENGYAKFLEKVMENTSMTFLEIIYLRYRITRIMALSYLIGRKDLSNALRVLFRYWKN